MYCPKCGTQNPDNAQICSACGELLRNSNPNIPYSNPNPHPQMNVPNYLVQSILVTLFCCLPLGIVSIITAMKVDERLRMGDYNGAVEASNKAKTYCVVAASIGIVIFVIYFFCAVLANM